MTSQIMRFGELEISFDARVLRPRPWTVAQANWAAELANDMPPGKVLELCSGAGHIGLSFGLLTEHQLVLVDVDENACSHAQVNAESAGLAHRVEVRAGALQSAIGADESFVFILADPPWVRSEATHQFPQDPLLAIDGGPDGMELARACIDVISGHLADDGQAIIQLGSIAQAAELEKYLDCYPGLALVTGDRREFGENGVLLQLIRPTAPKT